MEDISAESGCDDDSEQRNREMLKEDAVRSAQIYLEYLQEHREEGLGVIRARVRSMQGSLLGGEVVLFTDRVLRSVEGLVIRIGGTLYENTFEGEHFKVLSANRRKLTLIPSPEMAEHMDSAWENHVPIILEIDLTFLVKRVQNWYEKHGDKVELPFARPSCCLDPENPITLSDNQYSCAELAMSSSLTYIWGAPGTGKTKYVLASCVLSYIRAGKKVILVAPTNNALEQSLSGLLRALSREGGIDPAGKVIRLGVPGDAFRMAWPDICEDGALERTRMVILERTAYLRFQIDRIDESIAVKEEKTMPDVEDLYPDKEIGELKTERKQTTAELNELLNKSRKLSESGIMPLLSDYSVVAATVDTCLFKVVPGGVFKPDHVFLDEAGYCNVIKGMILLGFRKPVTLLGDHMQLPPVAEGDRELFENPEKKLSRLWKISSLYMESVATCDDLEAFCKKEPDRPLFDRTQVGTLTETHRFGPELAKVLAKWIYGPRFCSRSVNETQILFINAPKRPDDRGENEEGKKQRISHSEAKAARALVEANLSRLGVTLGIITPYRKQRQLLSDTMNRLYKKYKIEDEDMEDDIVTVHQSQGREWDIVLFSITDCFDEMFFTNSQRSESLKLINTAVSRAKKMLILIGDAEDWKGKSGQLISELFAVGREITEKEKVVEILRRQESSDEDAPWMGNYGSLYMALSIDEK